MKILIYGDSEIPGSGGWSYANTLAQMGHSVTRFSSLDGIEAYFSSILGRLVYKLRGQPLELHRRRHVGNLLRAIESQRPEIVIVLKGLYLCAHDIESVRMLGAWVANINHDDFFSHNAYNWSPIQRGAIPHYDFILATRAINVQEVQPLNPRVEFFPFAFDPQIHHPVELSDIDREKMSADVVFVGTWEKERCVLLEYLVERVPARYAIWGNSWEHVSSSSILYPHIMKSDVLLQEMAKVIGAAKVALGFLRKKNRDEYTQRTFEIPACNGVLLAERTAQHLKFYQEGVEAEFFDPANPNELVEKVQMLLLDETHREGIRRAGRAALLRQQHTYEDRLSHLIRLYERCKAG